MTSPHNTSRARFLDSFHFCLPWREEHRNFTRAGHAAGLTQSAITRQIRGMEDRLGVSIVPHRVLALHPKSRPVQRVPTEPKFTRELIVVVRRQNEMPGAVKGFVTNILFGN